MFNFNHIISYFVSVKVIPEAKNNYTRLPLVEIPPSEAPIPPVSQQQDAPTGDEEQQTAQSVISPTSSVTAATPKVTPKTPDIIMTEEGR